MTTELALVPPADAPPAPRPDAPTIDLLGLILTGLAQTSIEGYRADYRAFARFTSAPSEEAALWGLIRLEPGPANALVLAWQAEMLERPLPQRPFPAA